MTQLKIPCPQLYAASSFYGSPSMLSALALILGFQVAGEVINRMTGIPVPGSVIGMILMLFAFMLKDNLIEQIRPTAGVLLANLAILFVPAAVGVMRYTDLFMKEGLGIAVVLVVSTIAAMLVTAYTIIFVDKLLQKKKKV